MQVSIPVYVNKKLMDMVPIGEVWPVWLHRMVTTAEYKLRQQYPAAGPREVEMVGPFPENNEVPFDHYIVYVEAKTP